MFPIIIITFLEVTVCVWKLKFEFLVLILLLASLGDKCVKCDIKDGVAIVKFDTPDSKVMSWYQSCYNHFQCCKVAKFMEKLGTRLWTSQLCCRIVQAILKPTSFLAVVLACDMHSVYVLVKCFKPVFWAGSSVQTRFFRLVYFLTFITSSVLLNILVLFLHVRSMYYLRSLQEIWLR